MIRSCLLIIVLLGTTAVAPFAAKPSPSSAPLAPAPSIPSWPRSSAEELLRFVESIANEGLNPRDYSPGELRLALSAREVGAVDRNATAIFTHLAQDLASGHVRERGRVSWHIAGPSLSQAAADSLLRAALSGGSVEKVLRSLSPANLEYQRLKAALAITPARDKATIQRLRANLERWRWMPRQLGRRFILVNVPAFELTLVQDGETIARHRIIVGKPDTPTPQFSAVVTGVQLNPWWYVPQSIVAESIGKLVRTQPQLARRRGFIVSATGIRQRPGPGNALGQMKLVMPNPHNVYVHDTPTKALFEEEVRAFSHGCIRAQNAIDLAAALVEHKFGWTRDRIDAVVSSGATTDIALDQPVAIYVTYFTAATDEGGQIASFPDLYGRDAAVVGALTDREPLDPLRVSSSPRDEPTRR